MEPNKNVFKVMKTETDKTNIILINVLTMLSNRIYIDNNADKHFLLDFDSAHKSSEDKGDNIFIVKARNGVLYAIKIIFQKITAIGKQSIISEFLDEYENYKKIVIAKDFTNKISAQLSRKNAQIFKEDSMLSDLISFEDQPKFELLSPQEMEKVKTDYNITPYTTKKLVKHDPITRYFGLKKGDLIRIIRPSATSGEAVDYRIVT
ncbi:RNA polymerase subunit 5 [Cotonvirus japonicus]|uniref:RNA polymerase subunit 5 n=1 Tax=Cotonvirus japonicus TaxID=2811091 RepID=A0ABM7NS43_9VIRU|nr:RNA polymerase subunit 5 [Cotonvirus japonicus]BCS82980.1 RNA polymerase subunit 5 [Cotonvirus japonicus]